MKIKDIYGLDDRLEHFVIHTAEEELSAVEIVNVEIKKSKEKIVFNFYVERNDGEFNSGRQEDLSDKLQKRVSQFHKNYIRNVEIHVHQK